MSYQVVKLGEICDIERGGSPRPIQNYITDAPDGVNWIKISDATASSKYIYKTKEKIKPAGVSKSRMVYEGDFILSNSMSFGRPYIMKTTGCIHDGWLVLRKPKVDSDYLYHILSSDLVFKQFEQLAAGTTVKNINISIAKSVELPLPPLAEQKRIAEVLDKADALREKRRLALQKLDTLLQSVFLEMFGDPVKNPKGWKSRRLGSECEVGSSNRVFVDELVETGIPFYRGTEIGKLGNNQLVDPSLFITKEHYERLKIQSGVPQIGDLLLPSICPDGRIYLVRDDNPFYFKDGRVLWIKMDRSEINSFFLKYHLKQLFFVNYPKIASGTTFAELKIFALKDLDIHIPPIDLQNKFADFVKAQNTLLNRLNDSMNCFEKLFQSLQQRAFQGELFINDSLAAKPQEEVWQLTSPS